MFFTLSKLFWLMAAPSSLMLILGVLGVALLATRWGRLASKLMACAILGLLLVGASPLPFLLIRPLEDRFPTPNLSAGARVDGIIILGGAIGYGRDRLKLNDAGVRMTEGLALARRFPQARLVFTGGLGMLMSDGVRSEADAARSLFEDLGFTGARVVYEERSRNTYENAVFTRDLVQPKPGETWLLVTSAYHMPRAVGVFRQAGMDVTAYPVDFESEGNRRDLRPLAAGFVEGLRISNVATKEWIGLIAYRLSGYSDALFPVPLP